MYPVEDNEGQLWLLKYLLDKVSDTGKRGYCKSEKDTLAKVGVEIRQALSTCINLGIYVYSWSNFVPQKAGSTFPNLIGRRRISGCKWNFDRYCSITFLIFSCFLARLPPWSRIIRCIFGCFSRIASIHTSTHFCNTCNTITNQDVDKVNLYTLSQPR